MPDKKQTVPDALAATARRVLTSTALPFSDIATTLQAGKGNYWEGAKKRAKSDEKLVPFPMLEQFPAAIYSIAKAMGADLHSPYLDAAVARGDKGEAIVRRYTNTPQPANASEVAQEIFGGLILGVPGTAPLRAASQAPTAVKVLKGVAKAVPELILPFRQGSSLKAATVGATALGVGLTEGVDAISDVAEYNSAADIVRKNKKTVLKSPEDELLASIPGSEESMLSDVMDDEDKLIAGIGGVGDISEVPAADTKLTIMDKAMIGAAGLGTLGIALTAPQILRSIVKDRVRLPDGDLVGSKYNKQTTDPITNIISGVVQSDQAVRNALKADAPDIAKPIMARMDTLAPASINQKFNYTLSTGQFPNSTIDAGPIGPKLNAITTSFDEDELAMLDRGLLAKSALNTINKASLDTTEPVQPQFNEFTPAQLRAFADQVDANPRLRAAADVVRTTYRKLADYMLERGRINEETYAKWIEDNPDYVHLSGSVAASGDTGFLGVGRPPPINRASNVDAATARSLDEGAGVQAGQVASPLVELPKQIRSVIRDVEQNATRVEVLDALEGGTKFGVRQVAEAGDQTISVYKNGKITHYQVPDNALRYQLEFSPNIAQGTIAATGRAVNSLFLASTVGRVLNPLFSFVSASYEGMEATLSRPKGYHLGLVNQALSSKGLSIGPLDPTGGISSIPIGSVRYLWDSGIQQLASEAAQSLVDDSHILARLFPDPVARQALADRLTLSYEASIKGMASKSGALSGGNFYSHEDLQRPLQGIESVMPDFARYANDMAAREALAGNTTFVEKMLAASQNANVAVNSAWWARLYGTLSNSVRESVKYQGYASNLSKAVDQDSADILASQTRRIGGDMGQRGGNEGFNTFQDWAVFVNNGIQPLSEIARRIKDNPVGLATNLAVTTTAGLLAQYMAAASDPEIADRIRNSTDEQNSGKIYFPGGLEVPMTQSLRPLWGPLVTVMNEISGLNDGQIDPDIINVLKRWADSDFSIDETTKFGMQRSALAGLQSAAPVSSASIPALNAFMATKGVDMGMTRYAGQPVTIKEPSEFGAEDRAMSNETEKVLTAILGSTISNYIKAAMDFDAALKGGTDWTQGMKVALSRVEDKAASANGPAESLIFKGYEKVISPNDTDTQLLYKKRQGLDTATQVFRDEVKYPGMSGANPKIDRLLPTEAIRPEYRNTMLFPIGAVTYNLNKQLRQPISELNMLRDIDKAIQDRSKQFSTTIEQRNAQRNALIERRRELTQIVLYHMAEAEEKIQEITGDESFTYNTMDINAYKDIPFPPPPTDPGTAVP